MADDVNWLPIGSPRGPKPYTAKDRIERLSMPEPNSGCWLWLGTTRNGYGRITLGSRHLGTKRSISAHRLSYEAYRGLVPHGLMVCHKCDVRCCTNPDHLFVGTLQDNIDDRERKGRNHIPRGEDNPNAKLTEKDVAAIRREYRPYVVTKHALAKKYGVGMTTIKHILTRRKWKHVL